MKRTEVRKRMGLTDEHAEAAKGQMLAYIRDAVDRWNERTAQEQADADLPDVVWHQAQTEQADAAAATEAHNEHADAAAAPKRRRLKTKRPAAVVESSNEQAAAAEEAPNEEAGTAAAEEAPNKQPEDTPPDQQPGLSFVDWQLAQTNIRLVVEEMLADPVALTNNDVQPELAASDGQRAATPSGCSRASSVCFCIHCKKTFKSKNGFTRHSKTCKSQLKANEPETAVTAEAQAADAAPTKRFRKHAKSKQAGEPEFVLDPSLIQSAVQFPFPQAEARTWRVSTLCQQQPATQVPAPPAASQKAQPQEGSARRPRWNSLSSAMPQCLSEDEKRWEFIQGQKSWSDWTFSTTGQRVVASGAQYIGQRIATGAQSSRQSAPARTSATGATLVEAPEVARRTLCDYVDKRGGGCGTWAVAGSTRCCRHPLGAKAAGAGVKVPSRRATTADAWGRQAVESQHCAMRRAAGAELGAAAKKPRGGAFSGGAAAPASLKRC